ncbi:MAG: cobalamin B12-binding domain-containing protein [Methylobacteriaceae bacterium]|nr:cobalamin B12-binding domain-containing protein [Methylobacteriaceae bacterium]
MDETSRMEADGGWGPAERAAIERCLLLTAAEPRALGLNLSRVIETEIIPRLMLAQLEVAPARSEAPKPDSADIAEIASHAIGPDPDAATAKVFALLGRGCAIETVLLEALGGAARLLGDMWREDLCSFTDVTIGMCRLQAVLREFGVLLDPPLNMPVAGRMLLAVVPGEQHSFGLSVLDSIFRKAGWAVSTAESAAELRQLVRTETFDLVGLSLSCDVLFERTAPLIRALRRESRNPSLLVMVGGRYFQDNPDRVAAVGADWAADDADDALRLACSRSGARLARC